MKKLITLNSEKLLTKTSAALDESIFLPLTALTVAVPTIREAIF